MRDLTRGGLGAILNEIADLREIKIDLEEAKLPIQHEVKMSADMLGISPLYLANEGNIIIFLDRDIVTAALDLLHNLPEGKNARFVGSVSGDSASGRVELLKKDGRRDILDYLEGAEEPRLC